ncbi:MAG: phage major tail protein, TP901-1 family [Euryarchaeota archaeon]|jgi:TP901-1 family phage major tail protein|nr:phage major tail protein, TP901-1 family [Euryarchaeota archaeon]|tara:strand:- start:6216 stop:6641 length:426 start_codon:yes stop_codon:yes gene_type:complete
MAKQLGRALLLKVGDGGGSEVFTSLAGLNSKTITINNSAIDVTTPDASSPAGALFASSLNGLKSVSLSADGVFLDETAEARLNTVAMQSDPAMNCQILIPDFGTYAGNFRVTSLEFGGETEGGVTFSTSLESNGAVTFTAA